MRARVLGVLVGMCLSAAASTAAQQGTAEIAGHITDQQGAVLPGVAIVVTNEDSGVFRELVSTADGSYFVSQMVPGRYRVTAKLEGFRSLERRGLPVEVGKTLRLDITLEVGSLEETVTVTGGSPLVDLSTAEIGGHLSSQEITELPAGNRSYMALVGNVPGADSASDSLIKLGRYQAPDLLERHLLP